MRWKHGACGLRHRRHREHRFYRLLLCKRLNKGPIRLLISPQTRQGRSLRTNRVGNRVGSRNNEGRIARSEIGEREAVFIELCALRDKGTPSRRIPELPALITRRIPNKDALDHVPAQFTPLISLDVGIHLTPPHLQVGEIWFAAIEAFKWRHRTA